MKTLALIGGAAAILASAMATSAAVAAATAGAGSVSDVVETLKDQGYNVMLNGPTGVPLSQCTVTGVHNPDRSGDTETFTTVYVDIDCTQGN